MSFWRVRSAYAVAQRYGTACTIAVLTTASALCMTTRGLLHSWAIPGSSPSARHSSPLRGVISILPTPQHGNEQLPRANRRGTALGTASALDVDPNLRLGGVLGFEEPRGADPGDRPDERCRGDEPFEAKQGAEDASPVDPALPTVQVEHRNAPLRHPRSGHRCRAERSGQVADGHLVRSRKVQSAFGRAALCRMTVAP